MPKRPKHEPKPRIPAKPKRPSDPNRAAHAMIQEHMARLEADATTDFQAQLSAHMRKLGAKGGKASGAKRMEMPVEERRRIASLAARAMWARRKGGKKR